MKTTQAKIFDMVARDSGSPIRPDQMREYYIRQGFKIEAVSRDGRASYHVYNCNASSFHYVEIRSELVLRYMLEATTWIGLSHKLRELDMCASVDGYVEKLKSILNENLPKPADVAIQPEQA
jgi:hypothetical protein